jgi:uncharacterized iron-regulated membrane protein
MLGSFQERGEIMWLFIGIGIVLALVIGLLLWSSRRSYKPDGASYDVHKTARQTKLKAQENVSRWGGPGT